MEGDETNVPDREERKRIRAARVAKKLERESSDADGAAQNGEESREGKTGQQQIAESLARIDERKAAGLAAATSVRAEADDAEGRRRVEEEARRRARVARLEAEAAETGRLSAAVERRWGEVLGLDVPQELHDEIELQKKQCGAIIASKDALIRSFQEQLRDKDEQYVKALKGQAEDVERLLRSMRSEYATLREGYEEELKQIDDAFLQERDALLSKNADELDALFDQRRESELRYLEQRQAREEAAKREIEALQVSDAEAYGKTKVKLETEIQALEQQLEEMRATYQLNTEKLEYNYRVLTERDAENTATLARLKKQMMRLKDKLNGLVSRYAELETTERKKNDELTEEYNRITKQYKDLQAKFRHFETLDNKRYEDLFSMHEEEAQELVQKVLEADRIIHEQFLGYQWKGPQLEKLFNPRTALDATAEDAAKAASAAAAAAAAAAEEEEAATATPPTVSGEKLRQVLRLLAQEAGFLVDPALREALDAMPAEEAQLSQAEALLGALGVTDRAALAALMPYFHADAAAVEAVPGELEGVLIEPAQVVRAATAFAEDRKGRLAARAELAEHGARSAGAGATAGVAARVRAQQAKREREALFWQRLKNVVSEPAQAAWKALEGQMQRYNEMLRDRAEAVGDIERLNEQNAQLKRLLNQYLSAPVAEALIVPPHMTIRLDEETAGDASGLAGVQDLAP